MQELIAQAKKNALRVVTDELDKENDDTSFQLLKCLYEKRLTIYLCFLQESLGEYEQYSNLDAKRKIIDDIQDIQHAFHSTSFRNLFAVADTSAKLSSHSPHSNDGCEAIIRNNATPSLATDRYNPGSSLSCDYFRRRLSSFMKKLNLVRQNIQKVKDAYAEYQHFATQLEYLTNLVYVPNFNEENYDAFHEVYTIENTQILLDLEAFRQKTLKEISLFESGLTEKDYYHINEKEVPTTLTSGTYYEEHDNKPDSSRQRTEGYKVLKETLTEIQKLSNHIRRFIQNIVLRCIIIGQKNPAVLVRAVEIIEYINLHEHDDSSCTESASCISSYKQETLAKLKKIIANEQIQAKFSSFMFDIIDNNSEFEDDSDKNKLLNATLTASSHALADFIVFHKEVCPCFPLSYNLLQIYREELELYVVPQIMNLYQAGQVSSPSDTCHRSIKDLIQIKSWMEHYNLQINNLMITEDEQDSLSQSLANKTSSSSSDYHDIMNSDFLLGIKWIEQEYKIRVHVQMNLWVATIMKRGNFGDENETEKYNGDWSFQDSTGSYRSNDPEDIITLMQTQLDVAEENMSWLFVLELMDEACLSILQERNNKIREEVSLCINNNWDHGIPNKKRFDVGRIEMNIVKLCSIANDSCRLCEITESIVSELSNKTDEIISILNERSSEIYKTNEDDNGNCLHSSCLIDSANSQSYNGIAALEKRIRSLNVHVTEFSKDCIELSVFSMEAITNLIHAELTRPVYEMIFSKEWEDGVNFIDVALQTIDDYLEDLRQWIPPFLFSKSVNLCYDLLIQNYVFTCFSPHEQYRKLNHEDNELLIQSHRVELDRLFLWNRLSEETIPGLKKKDQDELLSSLEIFKAISQLLKLKDPQDSHQHMNIIIRNVGSYSGGHAIFQLIRRRHDIAASILDGMKKKNPMSPLVEEWRSIIKLVVELYELSSPTGKCPKYQLPFDYEKNTSIPCSPYNHYNFLPKVKEESIERDNDLSHTAKGMKYIPTSPLLNSPKPILGNIYKGETKSKHFMSMRPPSIGFMSSTAIKNSAMNKKMNFTWKQKKSKESICETNSMIMESSDDFTEIHDVQAKKTGGIKSSFNSKLKMKGLKITTGTKIFFHSKKRTENYN